MKTSDVDAVAVALRDAHLNATTGEEEIVVELFADVIELRHRPPSELDGPIPRDVLLAILTSERVAMRRAVPDLRREDVVFEVQGSVIDFSYSTTGTDPDGEPLELGSRMLYGVRDGRIISLEAAVDPSSMARFHQLLVAGGFSAEDAMRKLREARLQ